MCHTLWITTISQLKGMPKFTDVWSFNYKQNSLRGYVYIRYPVTLLINLKQFFHNNWLLNSLHDLEISLAYYNDITILVLDQNRFILPAKNARG